MWLRQYLEIQICYLSSLYFSPFTQRFALCSLPILFLQWGTWIGNLSCLEGSVRWWKQVKWIGCRRTKEWWGLWKTGEHFSLLKDSNLNLKTLGKPHKACLQAVISPSTQVYVLWTKLWKNWVKKVASREEIAISPFYPLNWGDSSWLGQEGTKGRAYKAPEFFPTRLLCRNQGLRATAAFGRHDVDAAEAFALEGPKGTGTVRNSAATSQAPHLTEGRVSPSSPHVLALLRMPALWLTLEARSQVRLRFSFLLKKWRTVRKLKSELRLNYF